MTGPQCGVDGQAGVMGPRSGMAESGCLVALAGHQSGRTEPAENGPCSVFLVSAHELLVAWKA